MVTAIVDAICRRILQSRASSETLAFGTTTSDNVEEQISADSESGGTGRDVRAPFIFVSYARSDFSSAVLIRNTLGGLYGESSVYIDSSHIRPATKWLTNLNETLGGVLLLIAIVGDGWTEKMQDSSDYVRQELECALANGAEILPVLVNQTRMPSPKKLPEALRDIATVQADYFRAETPYRDLESIAQSVASVLQASCSFDPQRLPSAWGVSEKEVFAKLASRFRDVPWDFERQRDLVAKARALNGARLELGVRYLIGIGPRRNAELGLRYIRSAMTNAEDETIVNFCELQSTGLMEDSVFWSLINGQIGARVAELRPSLAVRALKGRAILGEIEAERRLTDLADAGNPEAIRAMSEIYYDKEVTKPISRHANKRPAKRPDPKPNPAPHQAPPPPAQSGVRRGDSETSLRKRSRTATWWMVIIITLACIAGLIYFIVV